MERSVGSFASNNPRAAACPTMAPDPKRALIELEQAIDLIPEADKGAYLHAVRTVPALVQLESPPLRYLRFDSYNTWAAARRLVDYWQGRLELFGAERAYLPLRLTRSPPPANATTETPSTIQSALDDLDVEVVNCGTYMVLPKDSVGRPVILHDRSRVPNQPEMMDSSRRIRVFFYMVHVLIEQTDSDENSTFEAAMLTVFGNKTRRSSVDFSMMMKGLSLFGQRQILPIRFSSWHVVLLGTRNFVLQRVVPFTLQTCEALGAKKPSCFHIHQLDDEKGVEKLQEELQAAGFGLEGLPKVGLDGLWTIGCFKCWIDSRIRTERRMYSSSFDESASALVGGDAASTVFDEDDALEEQQRKRRQLEAAYARRKRARRKINFKVLQDEIRRHQSQQQELLQTKQKLEQLLDEAKRVVRLHASTSGNHQGQTNHVLVSNPSTLDRTNHSVEPASSTWLQPPVSEEPQFLDPRARGSLGTDPAWLMARESHQPFTSYASNASSNPAGVLHLGRLFPNSVLPSPLQVASGTRQTALLYDPLSQGPGQLYRATLTGATVFSPAPPYSDFDQAPSRTDLILNAILASRSTATATFPSYVPGDPTTRPPGSQEYAPADRFRNYFGP